MEIGYFAMPSHPPECGLKEGHDWDLQVLRWLDELGYQEAWIGEHHTAPWEPHPAPDLLLAQAFLQTKNIRLGPGGFLLPYHHPAELANRVAMLDHLSGGRLNFGVAASGLPSDWAMFNVDGMSGQNRDMTREALEIEPDTSLPGARVVRMLEGLKQQGRKPEMIVIDNGPEFVSQVVDQWAYESGVQLHFITPGRPMENGYIESFNGKFRDECLNENWFFDLADARRKIAEW